MGRTEGAGEGRHSGTDGAEESREAWTEVTTGVEKYAVARAGPQLGGETDRQVRKGVRSEKGVVHMEGLKKLQVC